MTEPKETAMRTDTLWTKTYERPWIVAAMAAGTIAALLWLTPSRADAQTRVPGGEIHGDRQELRQDRMDWQGDRMDVRRFTRQLMRLERAERVGDRWEERRARAELQRLMRGELRESRRDLGNDRSEARWDRDDTGTRWDDQRDAMATRGRLARERRVVRELASIETGVSRGAPWALDRERRLLREFSRLMREDALGSGRELREDRRELRNDLRDDRDEGRRDFGGDGAERQEFRNDRPAPPPPPPPSSWDGRPDDERGTPDRDDEDLRAPSPEDEEDGL